MKKIILPFILLIFCLFGYSQNLQTEKLNFYSCSIASDSINELIKVWSTTISDIKLVESEPGKSKYRWSGEAIYTEKKKIRPFGNWSFDITFLYKDGKVKFILNHFEHSSQSQYICAGGDLNGEKPNCSSDIITSDMWSEFKKNAQTKSEEILISSENWINSKIGSPNTF